MIKIRIKVKILAYVLILNSLSSTVLNAGVIEDLKVPDQITLEYHVKMSAARSEIGKKHDLLLVNNSYDEMVKQNQMSEKDAEAAKQSYIREVNTPSSPLLYNVILSIRGNKVYFRRKNLNNTADYISIYDGKTSLEYSSETHNVSFALGSPSFIGVPLPLPGLNAPNIPFIVDPTLIKGSPKGITTYTGKILDPTYIRFGPGYRPGKIHTRIVDGEMQLIDGEADFNSSGLPSLVWKFSKQKKFKNRWVAGEVLCLRQDDFGEIMRCEYKQLKVTSKALDDSEFNPSTWIKSGATVSYDHPGGEGAYIIFHQQDQAEMYDQAEKKRKTIPTEPLGKRLSIGDFPPSISCNDLDGNPISLQDYTGKVVLVDFWAIWCLPCRKEIPHIVELQQKYADKGLNVLGICLEDTGKTAVVKSFAEAHSMKWREIIDDTFLLTYSYGLRDGIPYNILIGSDGKIAAVNVHGEALNTALKDLLEK